MERDAQNLLVADGLEQLEDENRDVVAARRKLQAAIDERNAHALRLHTVHGVSLGQLAASMGLTRSAVQGMFRALDAAAPEPVTGSGESSGTDGQLPGQLTLGT